MGGLVLEPALELLPLADVAGDHRDPADLPVGAAVGEALHGDGELGVGLVEEGQLAGPDPVGQQGGVDLAVELGHDPAGQAGVDVGRRDLGVLQPVEGLGRLVQVERGALGVGHHDEVAGGLDDPGEPGVLGHHVEVALLGGPGLGDVDGLDAGGTGRRSSRRLTMSMRAQRHRSVGRAEADLDPVGGARLGHQLVPADRQLGVAFDASAQPGQHLLVVALDAGVAEEAQEAGVDVVDLEGGVDAGDHGPHVPRPERVGASGHPGAVLGRVTQDHATSECSRSTTLRGKRVRFRTARRRRRGR